MPVEPGLAVPLDEHAARLPVADRVAFRHDEAIDRIVRTWPRDFDASAGRALGMRADPDFASIVRQYIEHDRPA